MAKGKGKTSLRIAVDVLMAVVLVLVMATALVAEAPHEFISLALFALLVAHLVLNRRWFAALGRGRWTAVRALQTVVVLGLAICIVGQAASAVVLSKHALAFLPAFPGSALARRVHMLCAYWTFVFAFAHAGIQVKTLVRRIGKSQANPVAIWVARIAVAAIAVFGAVSFAQLGLPAYLSGQVQFAASDPDIPLACARWASVAALIAAVFHCLRAAFEMVGRKNA